MREGPKTWHEPARTMQSCDGCRYYEEHLLCHRFIGESDYESYCKHQAVELRGGLPRSIGRHHGIAWGTPSWCPFLTDSPKQHKDTTE